jgi:integrase
LSDGSGIGSLLRGARRPFRLFLWALMETGARPSELRRLKWNEVKENRFVIEKHKTVKKTGKPRVIFMTERLQRHIAQLRKRSASPFVFVNSLDGPWTGNAVRLQVDRIKKRCNLAGDVCIYMIRHTFATRALMRGVDPASVAELLGHKDIEMIMKVYSHLAKQKSHMLNAAELAAQRPGRPKPGTDEKRLSA